MTTLVLTVALAVGSGLAMAFAGEAVRGLRLSLAGVVTAGTSCAVIATLFGDEVSSDWMPQHTMFAGALAVCGGHLASRAVLEVVDADGQLALDSLLPGGSWIGALERLAVFVSLLAGMPEGIAVVLAVKGLGRYPELKVDQWPVPTAGSTAAPWASASSSAPCERAVGGCVRVPRARPACRRRLLLR